MDIDEIIKLKEANVANDDQGAFEFTDSGE